MTSFQATILKNSLRFMMAYWQDDRSIQEQRAWLEKMAGLSRLIPGVKSEPVMAGGVPGEWVSVSGAQDDAVILYLHGGGYVVCSVDSHRDLISRISRAAGIRALALNYRLAPEHPFPAALHDATQAYRWLLAQGYPPEKIILAGDSAGGGLALSTMVNLRDSGHPLPRAAVCISPWTDLAGTGESMKTKLEADVLLRWFGTRENAKHYAGDYDLQHPLISPLYADLRGLPPMLIQVGTDEILLDDSTRLADRAQAAGVDASLEIWEGMPHVFQAQAIFMPEARKAIAGIGAFIKSHISVHDAIPQGQE